MVPEAVQDSASGENASQGVPTASILALVWSGFWVSSVVFGIDSTLRLSASFPASPWRLVRLAVYLLLALGFFYVGLSLHNRRAPSLWIVSVLSLLSMVDAIHGLFRVTSIVIEFTAVALVVLVIRQRRLPS